LSSADFVLFTLQITIMLACAVAGGHVMRRLGQPAVIGEMIGGILLGPTLFGAVAPGLWQGVFNASASVSVARDAAIKLGMLFFLFVAGLEVNVSDLRRLGRRAAFIGLVGTLLPILAGVALVYAIPDSFWGPLAETHRLALALFIGMNLANSANPVIARVLMDLGLLNKDFGTLVMTATVVDDLINWTLFAIVLGQIAPTTATGMASGADLGTGIALVLLFCASVLVAGRLLGPSVLHWLRTRVSWPASFIMSTTVAVLVASMIAEKLGVHAFLGAFLVGASLGGLEEERHQAHDAIAHFALSFFAPIYFVSMGMSTDFVAHFDGLLVLLVVAVACLSKLGSVLLGARLAGMRPDRETWAIAFALNARGATGIILAGVGREHGVIDDRLFVAMVVMAILTSLLSGPAIRALLGLSAHPGAVGIRPITPSRAPAGATRDPGAKSDP
jgi:Kef-type K+ transport system membrane component KefB